jgi:hypothetical protein
MLALHEVITIHGSQKQARNIERAIYKSQFNINSVEPSKSNAQEALDMPKGKIDLKSQEETKSGSLENAIPDRKVIIGGNLSAKKEAELIETSKTKMSLLGQPLTYKESIETSYNTLDINPRMKPKKQRQRKMLEDRVLAVKAEVQR